MKFLCLVGTRPEAIKMAPIIRRLRDRANTVTLCSGQQTDMVASALKWFGIEPDDLISLPSEDRSLSLLTGLLFPAIDDALVRHRPDIVVAQGDTTTVMVTATACFYRQIPFAHVEAGLRTRNLQAPFPEEFNRVVVGRLAKWHFCPTIQSQDNLLSEGVDKELVFVTGNTVIDALTHTLRNLPNPDRPASLYQEVLVTAHRRENHGERLVNICNAIKRILHENSDVSFTIPVHPNPEVKSAFHRMLGGVPRVDLTPPLDYPDFVVAMKKARFILTDSGGIQEEAAYLGKPVLVMRDATERPEVVELGLARLIGTNENDIFEHVRALLCDEEKYRKMSQGGSPFGDGTAAQRICDTLLGYRT
jgi:UDP-N-acetylglucosamine 2-epimerase (non-hydrolysing)